MRNNENILSCRRLVISETNHDGIEIIFENATNINAIMGVTRLFNLNYNPFNKQSSTDKIVTISFYGDDEYKEKSLRVSQTLDLGMIACAIRRITKSLI